MGSDDCDINILPAMASCEIIFSFNADTTWKNDKGSYKLKGHFISPIRTKPVTMYPDGGITYLAVSLLPHALHSVLGMPVSELKSKAYSLDDINANELNNIDFSNAVSDIERINLIEKVLLQLVLKHNTDDCFLWFIHQVHLSKGNCNIAQLCESISVNYKTIERKFIKYTGITPKLYARLYRFYSIVEKLGSSNKQRDWFDFIVEYNYYDQAHFIREFKTFAGLTPKNYLKL
ncbi:MAG: helix-turn-helix domain-containing protein, partial [Desulfobacterales bacterium]|nr:helix-turn-helix domain-containing protein [Desulfobacterales bacterium]